MTERERFEALIKNEFSDLTLSKIKIVGALFDYEDLFFIYQAARRWIPVEKELPEEGREVIIYEKWMDIPVVAFLKNGEWRPYVEHIYIPAGYENDIEGKFVTHWQPLPEPPEEKQS